MIGLAIMIFIIIGAVMVINLTWQIRKTRFEYESKSERMKSELEYLTMKQATKLSYGERQRLNFALGKHWKR